MNTPALRDALEYLRSDTAAFLSATITSLPDSLGDAAAMRPDASALEGDIERLVGLAAGNRLGPPSFIAVLAATASRRLYPLPAQPGSAGRMARLLAHRAGYGFDCVERAVGLARFAHLPLRNDTPGRLLREASLEVDSRELREIAALIEPRSVVGGFGEACRRAGCWGTRFMPSSLPPDAPPHLLRVALEAALEQDDDASVEVEAIMRSAPPEPTGHLIVMVGTAASGKTRWIEEHLRGELIISMDRMRQVAFGDIQDQTHNEIVRTRSLAAIAHALEAGKRVVFDATNCDRESRRPLRAIARRTGSRVTMHYLDVPLDEVLRRNAVRSRHVPNEAVRTMYRRLEAPRPDEADEVIIISHALAQPHRWRIERDRWLWEARPMG